MKLNLDHISKDFKKELCFNILKLIKVKRKQSLTKLIKIKVGEQMSQFLRETYKLNNRFVYCQSILEDFEINLVRHFGDGNFAMIKNNSVEAKIFNYSTKFLDKSSNFVKIKGCDTFSIKFIVDELVN